MLIVLAKDLHVHVRDGAKHVVRLVLPADAVKRAADEVGPLMWLRLGGDRPSVALTRHGNAPPHILCGVDVTATRANQCNKKLEAILLYFGADHKTKRPHVVDNQRGHAYERDRLVLVFVCVRRNKQ